MRDIKRWLSKGLIDEDLASILTKEWQEENEKRRKITMQIVIYTIGVILLGTGVITFIAGNDWILKLLEKIPLLQTLILFLSSVIFLSSGWYLGYYRRNFPRLGGALVFLSTLLIGASYIQMGEMYNWSINTSSILILWFVSIFPLAFIFKSKPVNWVSIALFISAFPYLYYDWQYDTAEVWTVFMPFTLFGILYTFANLPFVQKKYDAFSVSYKLTALIPLFFTFLILIFSVEKSYCLRNLHYLIVPVLLILFNIFNLLKWQGADNLRKVETGFIVCLMLFEITLLILPAVSPALIMLIAHIFLIFIISQGLFWGYKYENVSLINLSNFFLLIYLLSVYCRYGWNYIDKTLFFLLGGAGLVVMGILLEKGKVKKLQSKKQEEI